MTPYTILKVKRDKEDMLTIKYQIEHESGSIDTAEMSYSERALPELYTAMQALVPDVIAILDLPEPYGFNMRVSGVTCKDVAQDGAETLGACVTVQKPIFKTNGPLVINTPFQTSDARDKAKCMTAPMRTHIENLQNEAIRFICGERAQGELKFEGE